LSYQQFKPDPALSSYIDAYWEVTGDGEKPTTNRILPDCCIDIIVNLGSEFVSDSSGFKMENEKAYLVGTMTRFKETIRKADTHLIGIRFKPGAFGHFYRFGFLHELTDQITEFEKRLVPSINPSTPNLFHNLDRYFGARLSIVRTSIFPMIIDINNRMGIISVIELAKNHYTTERQLQRLFKQEMGIGPKDFINFVRYQFAIQAIRSADATKSLFDIAFETGYYDHAHLTNEVKKYTGNPPSRL
jgi:AraC-like DNA-binding protein